MTNVQLGQVLSDHPRPISNLRRVIERQQLGLILGAGVSRPLHFPDWEELIEKISGDSRVSGQKIMQKSGDSQTSRTQLLFQHFRRSQLRRLHQKPRLPPTHEIELLIKGHWREIIHEKLYAKNPLKDGFITQHPYLKALLDVIRRTEIVINYNFDNLIEKGLLATRDSTHPRERGYHSTWRSCIAARPSIPLIFHPNGYLPDNLLEGPSDDLVFSEDSFADQLIDSMAGYYASVLHRLTQNTCVLLGVSLSDPTLKHLLRQHARMNPGHFHYHIAYVPDGKPVDKQRMTAVQDANFDVFNLITLFLHNGEISSFLQLLTKSDETVAKLAGHQTPRKFVFYVTGVPGIGKSTSVANLTSLDTFDEWIEERPKELGKKWTSLSEVERKALDKWVAGQFALRNYRVADLKEGVIVLDRCPLDPLSFDRPAKRKRKAKLLLDEMKAMQKLECASGRILLLTGDSLELERRAKSRHKDGDKKYFEKMQSYLKEIYTDRGGVVEIPTAGLTISQMIRRIARYIHFEPYKEFKCNERLRQHSAKV